MGFMIYIAMAIIVGLVWLYNLVETTDDSIELIGMLFAAAFMGALWPVMIAVFPFYLLARGKMESCFNCVFGKTLKMLDMDRDKAYCTNSIVRADIKLLPCEYTKAALCNRYYPRFALKR